jgi:DNA-binding GntR family transcriptional regulator
MEDVRIQITSIVDRVYDVLRERIIEGELEGGARLRQEALADELGVSRTPLREAFRRLASEGLVELETNRGARVIEVTVHDMLASYEARLALEPPAAARAAAVRRRADEARMRDAIERHRAAGTTATLFEANRAFHLALVDAAGNAFLSRFAALLWATRLGSAVYKRQDMTAAEAVQDADEHEAIANAVVAGDPIAAERLTRRHIATALAAFSAS